MKLINILAFIFCISMVYSNRILQPQAPNTDCSAGLLKRFEKTRLERIMENAKILLEVK